MEMVSGIPLECSWLFPKVGVMTSFLRSGPTLGEEIWTVLREWYSGRFALCQFGRPNVSSLYDSVLRLYLAHTLSSEIL